MPWWRMILVVLLLALPSWARDSKPFPYAQAGLSPQEAAAHLLSRFTFGARPGDVERVVHQGLEDWFESQLEAKLPDQALQQRLDAIPTLKMSERQMASTYMAPGMLMAQARKAGLQPPSDATEDSKKAFREQVKQFAASQGLHPSQELVADLVSQKLLRAVYTDNQLQEVMTDFWFNHFNVSTTTPPAQPYMLSYERDAIRPNSLGRFGDLLFATAHHPAMLVYLNNAQSVAPENAPTTAQARNPRRPGQGNKKKQAGLNENYARELMELHTLGVDGGYTQHDVTEVARALTGWTVVPAGQRGEQVMQMAERGKPLGFQVQGDFLFRADAHDAGPKVILGHQFPPGRGVEEGEEVLDILMQHPSTAHFVAKKLAVRFVSDNPPEYLVKKLADTYLASRGDVKVLLRTLVESPEFWAADARRSKVKSPFELMASSMRSVGAEVSPSRQMYGWLQRMGQPLYGCQPPTGFPDRAQNWINSGTLLNRMNFGLALAGGQVAGARVDLNPLAPNSGTMKPEQQLQVVAHELLPGRDLKNTIQDLTPLVQDPGYYQRIADKAREANEQSPQMQDMDNSRPAPKRPKAQNPGGQRYAPSQLAQVVGILLGSPEFQRR